MRVRDRLRGDLLAAVELGVAADELSAVISRVVASVVPHDAAALIATSPTAGLGIPSFTFLHGVEPDIGRAMVHRFYAGNDPFPPRALARRAVPAGVVGAAHDGTPEPDGARKPDEAPPRPPLTTLGVGSELQLLIRDARGVWGMLGLLRSQGAAPFNEADTRRTAELATLLVDFLRGYVTRAPLVPALPTLPPGVTIIGPDGTVRAATPQGRAWSDQLRGSVRDPVWVGESFLAGLATYVRRHAQDPRTGPATLIGPAAAYGRWIICQAQPLDGEAAGDLAVVVHAATGEHVLPSFCDWYGITAREREVVGHLSQGTAPQRIARYLDVSRNTVNDHIRAVFQKTGAGGRAELLAAIT
ncbi:helix-turn-helix transcriptional regulator [Streptomyces aureoverticillatus]|uniref:helix-turn-helix transcriptional regulator n=1 Tax=Streptomyces aureoverticillatus TaxID=66871 RepID=UPI0013DA1F5D|nr:helix-turn-helix transcriptional regulator [Streptomyces aureoverticillatus]QIB48134.1 helix-turn-helix transcriptional regulator [Streptomyces aureoverticillatus]